jgi:hypothetical protein
VRAAAAVVLLLLGAVVGLSATWTHSRWWALLLGASATLAAEVAASPGLLRIAYAGGWVAAAAYFLLARPEGDFVVGSTAVGYTVLVLGLLVVVLALATMPPARRIPAGTGRTT